MSGFIFGLKVFLFFSVLIGYFIYFKYIEKKCWDLFNYPVNNPAMKCIRIMLSLFCFAYLFMSSSKAFIFYIILLLIAMFFKDWQKTNLKYAGILLGLNIVGIFAIGVVYLFFANMIGSTLNEKEEKERYEQEEEIASYYEAKKRYDEYSKK